MQAHGDGEKWSWPKATPAAVTAAARRYSTQTDDPSHTSGLSSTATMPLDKPHHSNHGTSYSLQSTLAALHKDAFSSRALGAGAALPKAGRSSVLAGVIPTADKRPSERDSQHGTPLVKSVTAQDARVHSIRGIQAHGDSGAAGRPVHEDKSGNHARFEATRPDNTRPESVDGAQFNDTAAGPPGAERSVSMLAIPDSSVTAIQRMPQVPRRPPQVFTVQQALASVSQKEAASGGSVWGRFVKLISSATGLLADGVAAAAVAVAPPQPSQQQHRLTDAPSSQLPVAAGASRGGASSTSTLQRQNGGRSDPTVVATLPVAYGDDRRSVHSRGSRSQGGAAAAGPARSFGRASTAKPPVQPSVVCRLSYLNLSGAALHFLCLLCNFCCILLLLILPL
jgi:hypothetical protein